MTDPLAKALNQVTSVLEQLGVRFAVVGSLASSAHGAFRATADGDILADIRPELAACLASALGGQWYADADAIEQSIRANRSFNLIHLQSTQKIDIFPAASDFHAKQLDRAAKTPVFSGPDAMQLPVASPEDMILAKIQRFRSGGEVSERQWNDVVGLLEHNPSLDVSYMRQWAPRLRVDDLLSKALAGTEGGQRR
jgi:hypothetical protein